MRDIAITADQHVLVADRENHPFQVLDLDGQFIEQWTDVQGPINTHIVPDGRVYVAELWWHVGQRSMTHGVIAEDMPGRVSVLDPSGRVLTRIGGPDILAPGTFIAPHDIAVDSRGDIYVAEVTYTHAGKPGYVPLDAHTFQKLALIT